MAALRVVQVKVADGELLDAVVRLGDQHRRTLGLLPREVFRQSAADGTLLAAKAGRRLAGYALYGLPRQEIRLAHLCVAPEWTGHGVARTLVDAISSRHPDRRGIRLTCRRDYGIDGMWEKLDFVPHGDRPGRGADGAVLTTWWRSHHLPDLFSVQAREAPLSVAVDPGVFAAMHAASGPNAASEAQALRAEWLSDLIDIVITPRLLHHLNRIADGEERRRALALAHSYHTPAVHQSSVRQHLAQLTAATRPRVQGPSDAWLRHAAEAAAAGAHVLVTTDPALTAVADVAWEKCQLQVLPPAAVVSHVHRLRESQDYSPGLLGTSLSFQFVTSWQEGLLPTFGTQHGGGCDAHLAGQLRAVASPSEKKNEKKCALITDGDEQPMALYVWGLSGRVLDVGVLRTLPHRWESTLARQLVFILRQHCRDSGGHAVRVSDPGLSAHVRSALDADGFTARDGHHIGLVVDVCGNTRDVAAAARVASRDVGVTPPVLEEPPPVSVAAAAERTLWPAKLIDSKLPSFLLPIRPVPADLLFALQASLIPRPDALGLSREHVYYRAPRRCGERAPARLLWYASKDETTTIQAVIACSRLDEVLIDDADVLYDRLRHLGVFDRGQVRRLAEKHGGRAMALRFSDTHVLPRPVPFPRLRHLAEAGQHTLSLQTIFRISPELFRAVYEEGHFRT